MACLTYANLPCHNCHLITACRAYGVAWQQTSSLVAAQGAMLQQLISCKRVKVRYLNADLLPVDALGRVLLRLEAFAATAIKTAAGGRSVDAFIEAHFLVTSTSGAGEGHALDERLDGTDPHNCALHAYNLACSHASCCVESSDEYKKYCLHTALCRTHQLSLT